MPGNLPATNARVSARGPEHVRILHLGKYYAPQRGGIERHLQDLAEWSIDHGHQVTALVHQPADTWRSTRETINGVDVRRVGCMAAPLYAPISPAFPRQLSKAIKEFRPDVLHLHLPNPSCFAALASRRARALPWLVHWHADVSPDMPDWRVRLVYRLYRPFEQAVLARASAIVATSQAYVGSSHALARWKNKISVIALGIAPAQIGIGAAPVWPATTGLRLLGVGRLSHYKGFAVLLEALERLPDASLVLVGEGEESSRLRAQARRLGIDRRVSFVGDMNDADLLAAYANADVLVMPSLDRSEAFGLVLLEAMRSGLAVVASAIPGAGVTEVIENEVSGLLVPPGDASALGKALARLGDAGLRQRLAQRGQSRWEQNFTLSRSAEAVLALYRSLTSAGPPAAGQAG